MLPFDTSVVALARAIRARTVSSEEAVRLALSRIAERDPELGAFVQTFGELTQRWAGWLDGCDALLTPTVSIPPPKVGSFATSDGEAMFRAVAALGVWTAPFNVTGQPALSVPVGFDPDLGTPIGAQLAGPMGSEATLLALAARVEAGLALTRRPRVWAGEPKPA